MKISKIRAIIYAIMALAFYAINVPISKILLEHIGPTTMAALLLGFVAYGLSIFLYVRAQSVIGAAKTSAYYATAPFIGAFLSFVFLREKLTWTYLISLLVMIAGTAMVVIDTLIQSHSHEHEHTYTHFHDGFRHTYTIKHSHAHGHYVTDMNHGHHPVKDLEKAHVSHT